MTLSQRKPAPGPDWPSHRDDAGPSPDPRSLRRGLVGGASIMMMALALALAGPWSTQVGGTLVALGWIAAVGFGTLAYRGRPRVMVPLTKIALVLGLISLAMTALLFVVDLRVRSLLQGTIMFGTGGEGCTLVGDAKSFPAGARIYEVAHLERRVTVGEVVTLTMLQDGEVVARGSNEAQAEFDCLGGPLQPLPVGAYEVTVAAGGERLAEGAFEVVAGG